MKTRPSPYIFQSSRLSLLAHDTIAGIVEPTGELARLSQGESR
ncbi:MAG: hypothetical protein V7K27_21175 [Nostoc sp.]